MPRAFVARRLLGCVMLREAALQVLELLAGHMAQWACSVAYPELAHVPMLQLRRFAKKTAVPRFSSAAKALVAALEANCGFVEERRRACDFAPKDTGLVQAFLSEEDASQRVRAAGVTALGLPGVQCPPARLRFSSHAAPPQQEVAPGHLRLRVPRASLPCGCPAADCSALVQAPLQVYAKMLHEKVRRQRALQGADEVRTQHPGDAAAGAADEHDAAGEEEIDVLQQLQEGKKERRKEQKKQKRAVAPEPPPSVRPFPACMGMQCGPSFLVSGSSDACTDDSAATIWVDYPVQIEDDGEEDQLEEYELSE